VFLSRLTLNVRDSEVQREVVNVYELHRTLMRAFPDEESGGAGRVLFRLEDNSDGTLLLLVQSDLEPDWSRLQVPVGYLVSDPEKKQFDVNVREGTVLAFRLLANPTVRTAEKRQAVLGEENLYAWLERKAKDGGFELIQSMITRQGKILASKHGQNRILLNVVQYDGLLVVRDCTVFGQTVNKGIGSGKGFGFGMLSLATPG